VAFYCTLYRQQEAVLQRARNRVVCPQCDAALQFCIDVEVNSGAWQCGLKLWCGKVVLCVHIIHAVQCYSTIVAVTIIEYQVNIRFRTYFQSFPQIDYPRYCLSHTYIFDWSEAVKSTSRPLALNSLRGSKPNKSEIRRGPLVSWHLNTA
jgi:hypothetical protein